jgi:hypothetical protein
MTAYIIWNRDWPTNALAFDPNTLVGAAYLSALASVERPQEPLSPEELENFKAQVRAQQNA